MNFFYLPTTENLAALNMAEDLLMLEAFPNPKDVRFRHYGWLDKNTYTFGYFQKVDEVTQNLSNKDTTICRRPTGGGIVDHANDWTYSLVIPAEHTLYREKACRVYRSVHNEIAKALRLQNVNAALEESKENCGGTGVCFAKPSPADVIHKSSGEKIAGAALKRSKWGLLIQGSVLKDSLADIDWDKFYFEFTTGLSKYLHCRKPSLLQISYTSIDIKNSVKKIKDATWHNRR